MRRITIPAAQACGWCEGRGIVGRVVYYPNRGGASSLLRIGPDCLEVRGEIVDRPCGQCGGTGKAPGRRGILIPSSE